MGFTKFTQSEKVDVARKEEHKKIESFVKQAGKKSVEELTPEQKEALQISLDNRSR